MSETTPTPSYNPEDDASHHSTSQHSHDNSRGSTSCFFADMTLDLEEAHLEGTPRTEMNFATMISESSATQLTMNTPRLPLFDPKEEAGDTTMDREMNDRPLARISNEATSYDISTHSSVDTVPMNRRRPRRPRDVRWTAGMVFFLPLGLIFPHVYYSQTFIEHHNQCDLVDCTVLHPSWAHAVSSVAMNSTVFFSSLVGTVLSVILMRLLYDSPGGGDGDDLRHVIISRTLLLASNLSVMINPLLTLMIWHWLPNAKHVAVLPMALVLRDVYRARKTGSALPSFGGRGFGGTAANARTSSMGGSGRTASSSYDRKTFFRALACAALDILSRSLRRKSFVRIASALLGVQFVFVLSWWHALKVVLSVEVFDEDGIVTKLMYGFWLLCAVVAGKWATGFIARLLSLIASGGVSLWFAQQNMIIAHVQARQQKLQAVEQQQQQQRSSRTSRGRDHTYLKNIVDDRVVAHAMPEAYRIADAAVYNVMDFDDHYQDDDYQDDDYDETVVGRARYNQINRTNGPSTLGRLSYSDHTSTVKSFLIAGCTTSFGSVAQCGLLGGIAQFLWSVCRNMDAMGFFIQRRFSNDSLGFRGMDIGSPGRTSNPRQWKQNLAFWWKKIDVAIREFVRSHSDLAMSHVAAYDKGYQKAANDVAVLIEASGVEPIIHDDITTHICSCLCSLVSGCVVTFFGMLLVTHRDASLTVSKSSEVPPLEDISIFEILLFSYILCYTLLFTALEPLRAGIKAVYVCFAEHPISLSQAFPLIYQRLSRISETSAY